ncbi:MAG: MFS transporter [Planctomycetota bacterium]
MTTSPPSPSSSSVDSDRAGLAAGVIGWWAGFRPSSLPLMARTNYRRELAAGCFMPFMLTAFEGMVVAVLARIAFEGRVEQVTLDYAAGLLAVIPALANIASFLWVRLSHGRHKVRFITMLQIIVLVDVALMALIPKSPFGLWMLAAQVLVARVCWAGIITLRSTVWRQNYPATTRAQITGRFAAVQVLLMAVLGWGLGRAMDANENSFRVLFLAGAGFGVLGVLQWRRVRVRHHTALLREERETAPKDGPSFNPLSLVGVLTRDHRYAAFMLCQFLLGIGNITAQTLLALVLRDRFDLDYEISLLLSSSIPLAMMPFSIPLWARLLDGAHIVHFRAIHSWVFVVALLSIAGASAIGPADEGASWWLAALPFALLGFGALCRGIAFGGGVLAWTLGHLDFAPPEKASQYMGVHVTLTGVRGLISWMGGVALYRWIEAAAPGQGGAWMFVICAAIAGSGAIGFMIMSRWLRKRGVIARRAGPTETTPPSRVGI